MSNKNYFKYAFFAAVFSGALILICLMLFLAAGFFWLFGVGKPVDLFLIGAAFLAAGFILQILVRYAINVKMGKW